MKSPNPFLELAKGLLVLVVLLMCMFGMYKIEMSDSAHASALPSDNDTRFQKLQDGKIDIVGSGYYVIVCDTVTGEQFLWIGGSNHAAAVGLTRMTQRCK